MTAQRIAIALIAATGLAVTAEGTILKAYRDPIGLPTICMGHTAGVKMGDFRTLPECQALLTEDMTRAINIVDKCHPGLPTPILASFSDAVFNMGPKIACDKSRSTAARLLAAGKFREACLELPKWDRARIAGVSVSLPGLTKRREAEKQLCLSAL